MTNYPKPTFKHPLPPVPYPKDYRTAAAYVVAVWESMDARPITVGRAGKVTGWAIRKAFPHMRAIMASTAVGAVEQWNREHGGAP